jgi:hypothetical protein
MVVGEKREGGKGGVMRMGRRKGSHCWRRSRRRRRRRRRRGRMGRRRERKWRRRGG